MKPQSLFGWILLAFASFTAAMPTDKSAENPNDFITDDEFWDVKYNCHGSGRCISERPQNALQVISEYLENINPRRFYSDGEHISCAGKLCLFLQHTQGLYGREITQLMAQFRDLTKCTTCGSIGLPTSWHGQYYDNAEMTLNFVSDNKDPKPGYPGIGGCEGLCNNTVVEIPWYDFDATQPFGLYPGSLPTPPKPSPRDSPGAVETGTAAQEMFPKNVRPSQRANLPASSSVPSDAGETSTTAARVSNHTRTMQRKRGGAVEINCKGSWYCRSTMHYPSILQLSAWMAYIDPDRHFEDGEHIACTDEGQCAFLQHTGTGLVGWQIKILMEELRMHGCNACGSTPLAPHGWGDGDKMAEFTVNSVQDTSQAGGCFVCQGLCYEGEGGNLEPKKGHCTEPDWKVAH